MIGSVSSQNSLSGSMRTSSAAQPQTSSARSEAASGASARKAGVAENFKQAILHRAERFQNSGQIEGSGPKEARALADSLGQAAHQVREAYGQEAANSFMAKVLQGVDKEGFGLNSLTDSLGSALRDVAQGHSPHLLEDLTETFNQGLGLSAEANGQRETQGLSQAVADFFGLEPQGDKDNQLAMGFDRNGRWDEVAVSENKGDSVYIKGTPQAAEAALADSASSLTLDTIGEDAKAGLVDFLRNDLGAEEAATYLESASDRAGLMKTIDQTISKALEETGGENGQAARLENYLNQELKGAVNASLGMEKNPFGQVEFEGWNFTRGPASDSQPEGEQTYSSKWRYLNRDDVSYVRDGTVKQSSESQGLSGEEESPTDLSSLIKKVNQSSGGQNGELVNTVA